MLLVDVAAVADFDNQNDKLVVLDLANDADAAYSITPQACQFVFEGLAEAFWISQYLVS